MRLRDQAEAIFHAALSAVEPGRLVQQALAGLPAQVHEALAAAPRVHVVGGGKAGARMTAGLEAAFAQNLHRLDGAVNVPEGCTARLQRVRLNAARPVGSNWPTEAGVRFTRAMLDQLRTAAPDDAAIALISGGGSALIVRPAEGITLEHKLTRTRELQAAGADIRTLNATRTQLSAVKGGKLAEAFRGKLMIGLILSDVIGDPLQVIASGPTVSPDPTVPVQNIVIGSNQLALNAAASEASQRGFHVCSLGAFHDGDTEALAGTVVNLVRAIRRDGVPVPRPACLVLGGETTVRLPTTPGLGGRNTHFTLAVWHRLTAEERATVCVLSGGTDGEDGPTDAAGAVADASLLPGGDEAAALRTCDSYTFFQLAGGLIRTGLTGTNVADVRIVLVV